MMSSHHAVKIRGCTQLGQSWSLKRYRADGSWQGHISVPKLCMLPHTIGLQTLTWAYQNAGLLSQYELRQSSATGWHELACLDPKTSPGKGYCTTAFSVGMGRKRWRPGAKALPAFHELRSGHDMGSPGGAWSPAWLSTWHPPPLAVLQRDTPAPSLT